MTTAPDYNENEFAPIELLEHGDVDVWVRRRGAILLEKSKETAKDCEAGKLASAIAVGASMVMSANPLAWIPMLIGGGGYIYTLFQEYQDTGSIRLIPLYRGKLGDIIRVVEGGEAASRHPIEDQIEYLSEAEKDEVLLINYRFGEIAAILSSAPPKVRFDLYRHVCGQFHARRDVIGDGEVQHYINAAVSALRRTAIVTGEQLTVSNVNPIKQQVIEQSPLARVTEQWINHFIRQTALIWGNQGSGKSWMARYIAKRKKEEGYRVVALDPDSNRVEWEGIESYHDFDEIANFLKWYVIELRNRYTAFNNSDMREEQWRQKIWDEGKAIAVICEEVTTYVDLIDDKDLLIQFFRLGLTKSRKQEMPITFVSHNNTQSALGGIKGLSNLIEKMLQLELKTSINPETLQPTASGKGAVKLDGSNEWLPVILPQIEQKITHFGELQTEVMQPVSLPKSTSKVEDIPLTESITELKLSDSLGEPLKTIWLFAKEQGDWVKPREVQRKNFGVLKGKSSEEIRRYLGLLNDLGYGEIDQREGTVMFRSY